MLERVTYIIFICLLLVFVKVAPSQVRVQILDENNLPLAGTNNLLKFSDGKTSNIIAVGDENGRVVFENLEPDNYYLIIYFVSYKTDTIRNIQVLKSNEIVELGTHSLQIESESLGEFEIISKRPTLITNVDGDKTWLPPKELAKKNEDVLEMLRKIPSVSIDMRTNRISINGKEVQVRINGRNFSDDQEVILGYLTSLTAADIKKIELIQSGLSKYDGASSGGVIDIITIRSAYSGFNGNVNSRYKQGYLGSSRSKVNLNWKYKRFSGNVFYQGDYYQTSNEIYIDRVVSNMETSYINEIANDYLLYATHQPQFYLNFDPNNKNSIGIQVDFRYRTYKLNSIYNSSISDDDIIIDAQYVYNPKINEKQLLPAVNVNYSVNVKGKGAHLNFAYDYFYHDVHRLSDFDVKVYNSPPDLQYDSSEFRRDNLFNQPVHSGKFDFSKDFKRDIKIELGTRLSFLKKESNQSYQDFINGAYMEDLCKSEAFNYSEYVYAGYFNINKSFNDWNVDLGLRVEYSDIKQNYFDELGELQSKEVNFFPNINFFKTYGNNNTFRMGYNRGQDRPTIEQLSPFTTEISPFLITKGNPTLQPQIDNITSIEFVFASDYSIYSSYNLANKSIQSIFDKVERNIYNVTDVNFDKCHFFNLGFSAGFDVNKWWRINGIVNYEYNAFNVVLQQDAIHLKGSSMNFAIANQFNLPKSFSIDLNGNFQSPEYSSIEYYKSYGQLDASITKLFFNEKLTVRLGISDIIKTFKHETSFEYLDLKSEYLETNDSRRFELFINYRFSGNLKFKTVNSKKSNQEEIDRSFR